ncbi:MAG: DUF488 domain-containing protein [Chloroflexota bacterium]
MSGLLRVKRVYDPPEAADGRRFLVDRVWPRGVKKADLQIEAWLRDASPSTELRRWFDHDPLKWAEFKRRYCEELQERADALRPLEEALERGETVTLLYAARDTDHNNAVALAECLRGRLGAEP